MKSNKYLLKAMNTKKMSPAEFSRYVGISDSYVSKMMKNKRNMDTYTCYQVAEMLEINPDFLISMTNAEREKNEDKKEFWQEKVKEYGFVTLRMHLVILSLALSAALLYGAVSSNVSVLGNAIQYILCKIGSIIRRVMLSSYISYC